MSQKCAFCGAEIIRRCRCLRGDRRCANGHEYHYCTVHPELIVSGPSDHGKPGCSCDYGRTFYQPPVKLTTETT